MLRTALDPDRDRDPGLAEALASEVTAFRWVDALSGTAMRRLLLERGWAVDPDPWVTLQRSLGREDTLPQPVDVRPVDRPADVAARVAVQRSAFSPGSTFTSELWERMSTGPTYDARFDLVAWTPSGEPAAAATGWFAGVGRCAILEPVGTHQDHQRQSYGRRVNLAVIAALAGAGAGAVRVSTPASNRAAVATYEACGLRHVDCTTALTAP